MTAFSKIKPPQRALIVIILYLLLKDRRERATQESHTALANSDEGTRLGRQLLISGYRKAFPGQWLGGRLYLGKYVAHC